MTPEEYRKVLWQGLGRGVLFARAHPDMSREYREVILDACLHCRVFDFQIDGTRVEYMRDVIADLPDRAGFEHKVVESLGEPCEDNHKTQRYCFAAALAKEGDTEALAAMYRNFEPKSEAAISMARGIVYADGLKGFRTVVKSVFDAATGDATWFCQASSEILGAEVVEAALFEAGLSKPVHKPIGPPQQEYPPHFAKRATDSELLALTEEFANAIETGDWSKVHWCLRVFSQRPYPADPDLLLKLADADPEAPLRCSRLAINALKHITDPRVRELGCEHREVKLIAANFQPGDHGMVLDWYLSEQDHDLAHFEGDLIDFWKRYPQPETEVGMLLAIYEKVGCSFCRQQAVERLIELDSLPPEVREECRWDASEDIRKLVHS